MCGGLVRCTCVVYLIRQALGYHKHQLIIEIAADRDCNVIAGWLVVKFLLNVTHLPHLTHHYPGINLICLVWPLEH